MRVNRWFVLFVSILLVSAAHAQLQRIIIPAGTPEDQALQAISNEQDAQKRIPMLQDFLQKFSSNEQAVAYANWQLSQAYSATGDSEKALAFGEKALATAPRNLDIIVSQTNIAQQVKDWGKVVDYASKGGEVYNSLGKQSKPNGMSDQEFQAAVEQDKAGAKPSYEFLEAAAFNAITSEQTPKARMAYIEQFTPAFPSSKFQEQVSQYAIYSLQQLNDSERLISYGEKTLATDPNSIPTLILLANAYSEDPKGANLGKAITYGHKAIELAKADDPGADKSRRLSAGVAHSAIGYALMRQEKTPAAIVEFKSATTLLKEDPGAYATAVYRLGYAYAKSGKLTEARESLTEAAKIEGPFQQPAKELLVKVNSARAKGK